MNTTASDEKPLPPAAAYSIVEAMLTPRYFATPPPEVGTCLWVTGSDGVETYWEMDGFTASVVQQRLMAHRDVTFRSDRYTRKTRPGRL